MRVLVCGGRSFDDKELVYETLAVLREQYGELIIIQGRATGADRLAECWANGLALEQARFDYPLPVPVLERRAFQLPFEANWNLGLAAGPMRNRRMLERGKPDLVVAFPGQKGTANMVKQAKAYNVRIVPVRGKDC